MEKLKGSFIMDATNGVIYFRFPIEYTSESGVAHRDEMQSPVAKIIEVNTGWRDFIIEALNEQTLPWGNTDFFEKRFTEKV